MKLNDVLSGIDNCPCGRCHKTTLKRVEISSGATQFTAELLDSVSFPKNILVVSDKNELNASEGLLDVLSEGGYRVKLKLYDDMRCADMPYVREVVELAKECDGILSVGTGSVNDICRYGAKLADKRFAIFATAPSMDGFASDTAPITENGFKVSMQAKQPEIIIADTRILANAPTVLKSAGFGDMIAKYIGLVDWKISNLLTGEYYCEYIASVTKNAVDGLVEMADKVTKNDESVAGAIMELLIFTGVAMQFAQSSRPASGAEHVVSHFWESKLLAEGKISDFHGKKVGVATVLLNRLYRELAKHESITTKEDTPDWEDIKSAYGEGLCEEMMKMNLPETITKNVDPTLLAEKWGEIRALINDILPTDEVLCDVMKRAGAATHYTEVDHIDEKLYKQGLKYHAYMRRRITLTRLMPMIAEAEGLLECTK